MLGFGALCEHPLADYGFTGPPVNISLPPVALTLVFTDAWNPLDQQDIALANGNLTAKATTDAEGQVRSTTARSSGKVSVKFKIDHHNSAGSQNIGFGIASASHSFSLYAGEDTTSFAVWPGEPSTDVYFNGVSVASFGAGMGATTGDEFEVVIDLDVRKLWARNITKATDWCGNPSNDPATGAGGVSFAALAGGPWFLIVNIEKATDIVTCDFGNWRSPLDIRAGKNVNLPTLPIALAAPSVSVRAGKRLSLPSLSIALAAPPLFVGTGMHVSLPPLAMALAAPALAVRAGKLISLHNAFDIVDDGGSLGSDPLAAYPLCSGAPVTVGFARPLRLSLAVPPAAVRAGKNVALPPVAITTSIKTPEVGARRRKLRIQAIAN